MRCWCEEPVDTQPYDARLWAPRWDEDLEYHRLEARNTYGNNDVYAEPVRLQ